MDSPAVRAPDFPDSLDWLHTGGRVLTLADFRGRLLLLDFWTYGCINCLHVLPALREIEARYADSLSVVGVHSGKFIAERDTARLLDASVRLDARHPLVNDRQFRLWRAYAVRAWPTLVVIDPRGYVVGMQAGEFTADSIAPFLERVIGDARTAGTLVDGPLRFPPDAPTRPVGLLAFPGGIAVRGDQLAVADTAHHRVLVGTLGHEGTSLRVERVMGDGTRGHQDGRAPRFDSPHGLAFDGDTLLVADSGNHLMRRAQLDSGVVETVAGTGRQLRTAVDEARGAMSSPWDVAVSDGTAWLAMAGVHELWTVPLATGIPAVFSGSGAEEVHDAPHPQAALAQPMGLCLDDDAIWFADAESSAVRRADRDPRGAVRTIVGTGLFDFGDVDGIGDDVRLQHPQALARATDGRLLVCDTYNDALKWVEPASRRVTTAARGFHEPSGVALGERHAWVSDTNAHRIAVVTLHSGAVATLSIES
jgi:thiol-disulfide isomerase/thioredoxin